MCIINTFFSHQSSQKILNYGYFTNLYYASVEDLLKVP